MFSPRVNGLAYGHISDTFQLTEIYVVKGSFVLAYGNLQKKKNVSVLITYCVLLRSLCKHTTFLCFVERSNQTFCQRKKIRTRDHRGGKLKPWNMNISAHYPNNCQSQKKFKFKYSFKFFSSSKFFFLPFLDKLVARLVCNTSTIA